MESIKRSVPALVIALGLLALGLCVKGGIDNFSSRDRVVTVRGLAEKEVRANKVTWPILYKLVGDNLPSLYDQIEATNKKITDYLTSNGLSQSEYLIGAPSVTDLQADRYNTQPVPYRYNITVTITVTSSQVDLVNNLILKQGELLKQGVAITEDWSARTIYEYTDLNAIKPEMIAEATRNARQAANKFAEDSGSKIGKIKSASQGQFSIEDRDPYTPSIKNVRVVTYIDYYIEK